MTGRDLRDLAWLALTVAIGAAALCIATAALKVSHWCNRQGGEQRRLTAR